MKRTIKVWVIECDGVWYLPYIRSTRAKALASASRAKWLPGAMYKAVRVAMCELPKKTRSKK